MVALNAALQVLGFLEMPEDQTPPEEMWGSQERLSEWFAAVRQRVKDRAKGIEPIEQDEFSDDEYVDPEVAKLRK